MTISSKNILTGLGINKFMRKGQALILVIVAALVIGVVGVAYLIKVNRNRLGDITFNTSFAITKIPLSQTPQHISPTNWKTYKNNNLSFELQYPDLLYLGSEKQGSVSFGGKGVAIPYLIIANTDFLDYKNLALNKCLKYHGLDVEYCLQKGLQWKQDKDIEDIKLDKVDAKSFYISDFTCKYHIVQTMNLPLIEFKMCISREISDDIFKQILSTFKFLENKKSLDDLIGPIGK